MSSNQSKTFKKIIDYFKQCYQSDNREHRLWDVFSKNNEFVRLMEINQWERLRQQLPIKLPTTYGQKLRNTMDMYRREKALLFGQYFVVGNLSINGGFSNKRSAICSPLMICESALIEDDDGFLLKIDAPSFRWNKPLLSLISADNNIEEELLKTVRDDQTLNLSDTVEILKQSLSVDKKLVILDDITSDLELKHNKKSAGTDKLFIVPAAAVMLVKMSLASRGVIDELSQLQSSDSVSTPLLELFGAPPNEPSASKLNINNIPGILSKVQQKAVKNAAQKALSVVIGPPGTGKSYTIACIILERFMQGESVLLVTQNNSAVDVVQEKLIEQLGISASAINRADGYNSQTKLIQRLSDILQGADQKPLNQSYLSALKRIKKKITRAENKFTNSVNKAIREGLFLESILTGKAPDSFYNRVKKWWVLKNFHQRKSLFTQLFEIHQLQLSREQTLSKHINQRYQKSLNDFLKKNRHHLVKFDAALRAKTSMGQKNRFGQIDYSLLLNALPIWLCSLSSIHRALPLKKELFDLVIIDEATQCDIASCLPALHRGKRALIVGDPKQLKHMSFLSDRKQQQIYYNNQLDDLTIELNYRDHSMIDFANGSVKSQQSVVTLNEHYRSLPSIINFSNQEFYGGHLRVMTEKPQKEACSAIELIQVDGGHHDKGINQPEIDAIFVRLQALLAEQGKLPIEHRQSIGILSFFRDQVDAINDKLINEFAYETLRIHKLKAATPYGFQGEERDVVFISCVLDENSPLGAYRYLDRSDVFNVSVTRARDSQLIFVSNQPDRMPKNSLLGKYMDYVANKSESELTQVLETDKYINEIRQALAELGIESIKSYSIAGILMDLVTIFDNEVLVIDLIGFPGDFVEGYRLEQYKVFERAGLTIFPMSFNAWTFQRSNVLAQIQHSFKLLNKHNAKKFTSALQCKHWRRIQSINPPLAQKIFSIEKKLTEQDCVTEYNQLDGLVSAYLEFLLLILKKLNRNELTFQRCKELLEQNTLKTLDYFIIQLNRYQGDESSSCQSIHITQNIQNIVSATEYLKRIKNDNEYVHVLDHLEGSIPEKANRD